MVMVPKLTSKPSKISPLTIRDSRRGMLESACQTLGLLGAVDFGIRDSANAAETVGKDPECNDATCLGVWDGLLADCPHSRVAINYGAGCVSSQDDTPRIFAEPWDYSEVPTGLDPDYQMRMLIPAIELVAGRRGDKVEVLMRAGRYLRVLFSDTKTNEKSIGEFYFTENDTTVQFRIGSLSPGSAGSFISSSLRNMERAESIRKELRYLKIPVLRNRKRSLFFGESDFDTFGPGSAALGPPADMSTGDLEGRQDVDPKLKIDLLQSFPRAN
eukprot:CAMPEP_0113526774 /NCGR_PEP_ID=MMETSP0015_2-20120614/929_1 /TAXON_ID=2838 /ORGANISM="Odontella" /LENGTH=271 /DNA_ID=CAMNT_0000425139 /DNA_START=430 /DNA_END=1245 /DNA_ORIENTATION=+ /assembly_acc=CAM_ASM_000160